MTYNGVLKIILILLNTKRFIKVMFKECWVQLYQIDICFNLVLDSCEFYWYLLILDIDQVRVWRVLNSILTSSIKLVILWVSVLSKFVDYFIDSDQFGNILPKFIYNKRMFVLESKDQDTRKYQGLCVYQIYIYLHILFCPKPIWFNTFENFKSYLKLCLLSTY